MTLDELVTKCEDFAQAVGQKIKVLTSELANKVTKETGKGLSESNYTIGEKNSLGALVMAFVLDGSNGTRVQLKTDAGQRAIRFEDTNGFRYLDTGGTAGTDLGYLRLFAPAGQASGAALLMQSNNGANSCQFQLDGAGNLVIRSNNGNGYIDVKAAGIIAFRQNLVEKARLHSDGTFLIGKNGSNGIDALQVAGSMQHMVRVSPNDPANTEITAGYAQLWKNSTTGVTKWWINDGGLMKSTNAFV